MQINHILLFGAGKSATALIDYLIANAEQENWHITIADIDAALIVGKTNYALCTTAVALDIHNTEKRNELIEKADLVISMMPPALHFLIAQDCILYKKNLLTASYVDGQIKSLQPEIEKNNLLFLCEMGLDPGIDHMSAMQLIDEIKENGGEIISFKSHCGGLVAPESDDNPWRYKISWNPRNVVLAGKAGALYQLNGHTVTEKYEELFEPERGFRINDEIGFLGYYPNRDSLPYMPLYGLENVETFMRTTLRYPDFLYGWNNVVELALTDETPEYQTDGISLAAFFKSHFGTMDFSEWVNNKMGERIAFVKNLAENLNKLMEAEAAADDAKEENPDFEKPDGFSLVNEMGEMENVNLNEMKEKAARAISHKMHEANLTLKQLFFLGMDDDETIINKGFCSAADVLQFALETKLALHPTDKDMVVMAHEIEYQAVERNNEQEGKEQENKELKKYYLQSTLIVKGDDNLHTAMAKTVGLPLGIAAKFILNGTIKTTGLQIPTKAEIYKPVLKELKKNGIVFQEEIYET